MGGCFSKKTTSTTSPLTNVNAYKQQQQPHTEPLKSNPNKTNTKKETEPNEKQQDDDDAVAKKEIFVIKHRKSHDRAPTSQTTEAQPQPTEANAVEIGTNNNSSNMNMVVRTSSCTKEEVDAILIQCGRLSRSNSSGTGKPLSSGRKYSGSKRSYDFDQDVDDAAKQNVDEEKDDEDAAAERRQHRQRNRQSGGRPSPSPQGRRRTPSRERDQQRSGSRERNGGNGGGSSGMRRVSRSPGRRSEISTSADNSTNSCKPGKMVSVPPTVSNNGVDTMGIKRISVKRNVGEGNIRTAASPRSQSPARMNGRVGNENSSSQPSLSRNSSRKAEQSPYRRNPLSEIDNNGQAPSKKLNNCSTNSLDNKVGKDQNLIAKEAKGQLTVSVNVVASSAAEGLLKPEGLTRSRSARRSRDLDFSPEALGSSYTALLLEDIQNFHQKNAPMPTPAPVPATAVSIPACVAKACSIVEAVADLNSTTGSNMSYAFSEERRSSPTVAGVNLVGKKNSDPFVESEVIRSDDLMEPSFHKYVTVRRGGGLCGEDMDGQESSGSNSYVGGNQQQWGFSNTSSSWELNSADSTDRWTSRSNNREDNIDKSPLGVQRRHTTSEPGCEMEDARKGFTGQRNGIVRGKIGDGSSSNSSKTLHRTTTTSIIATNVST